MILFQVGNEDQTNFTKNAVKRKKTHMKSLLISYVFFGWI